MAYVVLLPVYGPLIDASFVERLPYHKHAYPHGAVASHIHSYEVDGTVTSAGDVAGVEGGVVALASGDDGVATAFTAVLGIALVIAAAPLVFTSIIRSKHRLRAGLSSSLDPPPPRLSVLAFA
ncbi:MAG: hypothetical protein WD645_02020 [Dehalococcoidia bacterium]